jgi:hypothetical protein
LTIDAHALSEKPAAAPDSVAGRREGSDRTALRWGALLLTGAALLIALAAGAPAAPAVSVALLVPSLMLMQRVARISDVRRVTFSGAWYLTYLVMLYAPAFFVYIDQIEGAPRDTYLLAVASVLLTAPLGMLAANWALSSGMHEVDRYFEAPIVDRLPSQALLTTVALVVLGTSLIAAVYFATIQSIPLLYMFANPGSQQELAEMREESFKLLDPRWGTDTSTPLFYAFLFLRTLINPYVLVALLGLWMTSRSRWWGVLFLVELGASVLYASASLARAPVAALMLRLLFFLYLYRSGRISARIVIPGTAAVLLFPLLVTELAYTTEGSLLDGLYRVWRRLTYTSAWGLYEYFQAFPEGHDFLMGHSLIKPFLQVLRLPYFYVENFVYIYTFPNSSIPTGHMNAAFPSNFWADFGMVGVILGGVATGMWVQASLVWLVRRPKDVLHMAIYPFLIYAFYVLNFGSVTSVMWVNGAIPVLFFPWGLRRVATYLEAMRAGRR